MPRSPQDNRFLIRDKESRYGTFVNGERITERPLVHGDRIRLGRSGGTEMVFLLGDSAVQRRTRDDERRSGTCARSRRCSRACARSVRTRARGRPGAGPRFGDRGHRRRARVHHARPTPTSGLEFKLPATRGRARSGPQLRHQPQDSPKMSSDRRAAIVADLLDGDLATCTWARWRSASATCSACRCGSCVTGSGGSEG